MEENNSALKLMEAFAKFHKVRWHRSQELDVKFSEILVLKCLNNRVKSSSGMKVLELSNHLDVTSPTVTQLVNNLEKNNLVERKIDQSDRRAVQISITDKGRVALKKAETAFMANFVAMVEFLGEEDSLKLAELLGKVYVYFIEEKKAEFTS